MLKCPFGAPLELEEPALIILCWWLYIFSPLGGTETTKILVCDVFCGEGVNSRPLCRYCLWGWTELHKAAHLCIMSKQLPSWEGRIQGCFELLSNQSDCHANSNHAGGLYGAGDAGKGV